MSEKDYNELSHKIISACIEVHKVMGPGLHESVYEACLLDELQTRKMNHEAQVRQPVLYKGKALKKEFVMDVVVNDLIVLELKSVETLLPIHEAQLLTYLRLSGKKLGLLINFNVEVLITGIKRKINGNLNG